GPREAPYAHNSSTRDVPNEHHSIGDELGAKTRQSGCQECRADDDGQADQRIEAWCTTYPSVVPVAAIATFPSGAIACSSWTPPSVCRPTRWICSLANSGDFAVNR